MNKNTLFTRFLGLVFSSILVLSLLTTTQASSIYAIDLQGGTRVGIDFSSDNSMTDSLMFMPLDLGIYFKVMPKLYVGSNLVWYYHSEDGGTINWLSLNADVMYRFLKIKKKFHLYGKFELGLFNYLSLSSDSASSSDAIAGQALTNSGAHSFITIFSSDPEVDGLKWNINQPNFRIGAGGKYKVLKKLWVYTELLLNFFTVEVEVELFGKQYSDESTIKSILFTGGVFYTI